MANHIDKAIHDIKEKIKNGRYTRKKIKITSTASQNLDPEVAHIVNDVAPRAKRKEICKKARNDINPADGAHNVVADTKRKISNEVRKDLGID